MVKKFIGDSILSTGFTRLCSRKNIQNLFGSYFFTVIERTNLVEKKDQQRTQDEGGDRGAYI